MDPQHRLALGLWESRRQLGACSCGGYTGKARPGSFMEAREGCCVQEQVKGRDVRDAPKHMTRSCILLAPKHKARRCISLVCVQAPRHKARRCILLEQTSVVSVASLTPPASQQGYAVIGLSKAPGHHMSLLSPVAPHPHGSEKTPSFCSFMPLLATWACCLACMHTGGR
eukprot:990382-Pelagomonas_calceolata.AAC.2